VPISVKGSAVNSNACVSTVRDPSGADVLPPDDTGTMDVTFAATAFPQPHQGNPITLSKTSFTVAVPADLLQKGVTLNLVHDGQQIPSTVNISIAGSNTTEKTHAYATINTTATVSVVGGQAQPLAVKLSLPDTVWHPTSKTAQVVFTQTVANVKATLDLFGTAITAAFSCHTTNPNAFLALSGEGPPPTTTTTATPVTQLATSTTTTTVATGSGSGTLPRTGGQTLLLLVLAAALIDLGLGLWSVTRTRRPTA
jgi:hypothetical protein